MKSAHRISAARRVAGPFALAALLFFAWAVTASAPAKADTVFNVTAVTTTRVNSSDGPATGDVVDGTITINTATGVADAIDIYSPTNAFTAITTINASESGCNGGLTDCVFYFTAGDVEYGQLVLGSSLVGYTGGPLAASGGFQGNGSFINFNSVSYDITGTVATATPEPSPAILVLSGGMAVLLFAWYRRRLVPSR